MLCFASPIASQTRGLSSDFMPWDKYFLCTCRYLGGCKGKRLYIFLILNFLYVMRFSMIFNMQLLKNIKKVARFQKIRKKKISFISAANFILEMSK